MNNIYRIDNGCFSTTTILSPISLVSSLHFRDLTWQRQESVIDPPRLKIFRKCIFTIESIMIIFPIFCYKIFFTFSNDLPCVSSMIDDPWTICPHESNAITITHNVNIYTLSHLSWFTKISIITHPSIDT